MSQPRTVKVARELVVRVSVRCTCGGSLLGPGRSMQRVAVLGGHWCAGTRRGSGSGGSHPSTSVPACWHNEGREPLISVEGLVGLWVVIGGRESCAGCDVHGRSATRHLNRSPQHACTRRTSRGIFGCLRAGPEWWLEARIRLTFLGRENDSPPKSGFLKPPSPPRLAHG